MRLKWILFASTVNQRDNVKPIKSQMGYTFLLSPLHPTVKDAVQNLSCKIKTKSRGVSGILLHFLLVSWFLC